MRIKKLPTSFVLVFLAYAHSARFSCDVRNEEKRARKECRVCTHGEIFSKSYQINPISDCIYHFSIYLEQKTDNVRLDPNQSENGKYNLISG